VFLVHTGGFGANIPILAWPHLVVASVYVVIQMVVVTIIVSIGQLPSAHGTFAMKAIARNSLRRIAYIIAGPAVIEVAAIAPNQFIVGLVTESAIGHWAIVIASWLYYGALWTLLYLWVPSLIAERGGLLRACRRVLLLGSGQWFRIIALVFLVHVGLATWLLKRLMRYGAYLSSRTFDPWSYSIAQGVATSVYILTVALVSSAAYQLLKRQKDGRPPAETVGIFE
jgi:hypothetical protein